MNESFIFVAFLQIRSSWNLLERNIICFNFQMTRSLKPKQLLFIYWQNAASDFISAQKAMKRDLEHKGVTCTFSIQYSKTFHPLLRSRKGTSHSSISAQSTDYCSCSSPKSSLPHVNFSTTSAISPLDLKIKAMYQRVIKVPWCIAPNFDSLPLTALSNRGAAFSKSLMLK